MEGAAQVFQDLGASVEPAPFQVDIGKLSSILGKLTGPLDFISYGHLLNDSAHLLMSYVREGIERGGTITAHEYAMALAELQQFRAYVDDFFTRYDLLLTPTLAVPPFPCGQRHDDLVRIVLPYSRNVSAVENLMEEEAMRGQMTTGTLGFTPT